MVATKLSQRAPGREGAKLGHDRGELANEQLPHPFLSLRGRGGDQEAKNWEVIRSTSFFAGQRIIQE
jgi:hypothetical protein